MLEHLGLVLIWLSDSALLTHLVISGLLADAGYCYQICSALHGWDCAPALWSLLVLTLSSLVKTPPTLWNKCCYLPLWRDYSERENTFDPDFRCILLWYIAQSVLNKIELKLQFQRSRHNSIFWHRICRHSYPTSSKTSKTGLHSARGKMGSVMGGKKDWEVASALLGMLCLWLGSERVPIYHSPPGQAVSPELLLGEVSKQPGWECLERALLKAALKKQVFTYTSPDILFSSMKENQSAKILVYCDN